MLPKNNYACTLFQINTLIRRQFMILEHRKSPRLIAIRVTYRAIATITENHKSKKNARTNSK